MLAKASHVFNPVPRRVVYLYNCYQNSYADIKRNLTANGVDIQFIQATILNEEQLKELAGNQDDDQCIVAIDDSTTQTTTSKELAHLFTVAHHYRISIVCFWHLIFASTPPSRVMAQNTGYYLLLNSPKMQQQVAILGSQLGLRRALQAAYDKEMEKPYSYILVDLVTNKKDMRIRTNLLDDHQIVFLPVM